MPKLTELHKILLGKGAIARTRPADCAPWQGMGKPSSPPYSREGVEENKRLYPHLFRG